MENEHPPQQNKQEKQVISIHLEKGEMVRIETVSDRPEQIFLRANPEDGEIAASRNPENFPIQVSIGAEADRPNVEPENRALTFTSFWNKRNLSLAQILFISSILIYFLVRIVQIVEFPIFFFTDEAVHAVRGQEFLNNGLRNRDGVFLPTFFRNTFQFNLSTSVYLQSLGYLLFGKSILGVRLLSMLSTLPAAAAMGLILKRVYKLNYWFVGVLFFSIVPAWFLHSRTAFEVVQAIGAYGLFVYFYFQYRETAEFKNLAWALVAGSLSFYSYAPARIVVVMSGLLLFLSDAKFHFNQLQHSFKGLGLLIVLVLPYFRHQRLYPQSVSEHLYGLGSYWVRDLSLSEKWGLYFQEYLQGLSPVYWYMPEQHEWVRHHMFDYGHLSRYFLPFAIWGLLICIYRVREAKYRNLILLLLAAPTGAAMVEIYITRAMFFIVPATIITLIGLLDLLDRLWQSDWFQSRFASNVSAMQFTVAIFILFAFFNVRMLADVLSNGPTWYSDYGLSGLQFGAKEVFGKAHEIYAENPDQLLYISNSWTNGTNTVGLFFFEDPLPFRLVELPRDNLKKQFPMQDDTKFILSKLDFEAMESSGKFTNIAVEETILWPNGEPGFYILTADYVDNIEEIFAAELAELLRPREAKIAIAGQPATVFYPALDMGRIEDIFDGNILTLGRTYEGNPANYQVIFDNPITASGLSFDVHDRAADITATIEDEHGQSFEGFVRINGQTGSNIGEILFDSSRDIKSFSLVVDDPQQGPQGHVHLWEIKLITD